MADSILALKALAVIMTIAFATSGLMLIDANNKYRDLTDRYSFQSTQIAQLQSKLNQTEASLSTLNATLTILEKSPLVKASTMIIDVVGLDYFNKYFHDPTVQTPYISTNDTSVVYKYRIEVNDYSYDYNVSFYFAKDYVVVYGIPLQGNMQPYKVSAADAKRTALEAGLFESPWGSRVDIVGYFGYDIYPLPLYADKYVWQVTSYIDPPWARTRTFIYALVDPITGEVYKSNGRGGQGLVESQVDTPEEAAALGITGYVLLDYPELPDQIQIVREGNFTFRLSAKFTSYSANMPFTKLYVDPQYRDPFQVQSNMADRLRGLISYAPEGSLTLRPGEIVNITATIRFPDDEVGQVFLFHRYALDGLGIGTDDVLVLSDLEA